jgi:hypothetical protein
MNHERFKSMKYNGYQQLLTLRDSAFYLKGCVNGFLIFCFFFGGGLQLVFMDLLCSAFCLRDVFMRFL